MPSARRPAFPGRLAAGRLTGGRWAIAAIVATMSLAGCVSMPSSGPPTSLTPNQSATGPNQAYVALVPAPPAAGWTPSEIVQGFLTASVDYSANPSIANAYLTPAESKTWNPHWSATVFNNPVPGDPVPMSDGPHGEKRAIVTVYGQVLATLNGSGELFSAVQGDQSQPASGCDSGSPAGVTCEQFILVKVNNQWRISSPPSKLLFSESDFGRVYQSQDVYFFGLGSKVLVPGTVFVPLGTSVTELLDTLVETLIGSPSSDSPSAPGPPTWLNKSTQTSFPPGTTLRSVTVTEGVSGSTAIVNLSGTIARARPQTLQEASAQLVLTLAGSPGEQSDITAVELEINGNQQQAPNGSTVQTPADYQRYIPFPSAPTTFAYVDGSGAAQSRCGSVDNDPVGGVAVPIFSLSGSTQLAACGTAAASPTTSPTAQPTGSGKATQPGQGKSAAKKALSMVAVSPDGKYVAGVSSGDGMVSIWRVGSHGAPVATWPGTSITSISWDRQPDLWITTQNDGIWTLSPDGKSAQADNYFSGPAVTALSIAPDGVRAAAIVGGQLYLAAIIRGQSSGQPTQRGSQPDTQLSIGQPVPLGPGITSAVALTWYDADDLMVITKTGSAASTLKEVPVNGRAATTLQPSTLNVPPGVYAKSIAADNAANVLAVGLSNGQLEVLAGLNGTWQDVGAGAAPAYGGLAG